MREEDRFSDRHVTGHVVEVYDGRKWPVVRCDNICISQTDTAHKVTQAVLLTPSVNERKWRASKYTVAVGTTHGHVQAFLKDSDIVLGSYQRCHADEKCLMLIKRPKDASRKLLKTQSLNNLSMSDTQLYRQYDGTAVNNPFIALKSKITSHSAKEHVTTDIINTQPRVRKPAPSAPSRYTKKNQGQCQNTFVPIPELGIYTPEQHVLQNGTYAQHCHNREVNNNNRKNQAGHLPESNSSTAASSNGNFSVNTSFDESVSSFGLQNKGVLHGFDNTGYGQANHSSTDVYHSCIDLPNSHHNDGSGFSALNTTNLCNPGHRYVKNVSTVNNNSSAGKNYVPPSRDIERVDHIKMDPSARSHSLGDLTVSLAFSLVGQKKSESVVTITDSSRIGKSSVSSRNTASGKVSKVESCVKDVCERFKGFGISSQAGTGVHASTGNSSSKKLSSTSFSGAYHNIHHQPRHHSQPEESYKHKLQHQQQLLCQQQLAKQHSAPEGYSQPFQHVASPRIRKDSEDTTSSYKSALSEVRSFKDIDNEHRNNVTSVSAKLANGSIKNINNTSYLPSSNSAHSTITSSKDSCIPAKTNTTVMISNPVSNPNREQSPVKPRRSLPSVPLNETSERIKRFTEMMKSRMSASSRGSRNCSVDSYSSKHTPSRKSSVEMTSDSEVFLSPNDDQHYQAIYDNSQKNGFSSIKEISNQMPPSQSTRSHSGQMQDGYNISQLPGSLSNSSRNSGYQRESNYGAKDAHIRYINRRKSYGDDAFLQDSGQRVFQYSWRKGNFDDSCQESPEECAFRSQYHSVQTSGETPLPPGDRSTDSGQTTITNHSYNGSALDSGYTTNNDGENDSCKSNPQHHHHQKQQRHPKQQFHPAQFQQQHQHNGNSQSNVRESKSSTRECQTNLRESNMREGLTDFSQHNLKYRPSDMHSNNLASSHRFGSVQNVSSAQAHGNPKDFNLWKDNQLFYGDKFPDFAPSSPALHHKENGTSQTAQDIIASQKAQNGSTRPVAVTNDARPVNQLLDQMKAQDIHRSANRRSWDYTNGGSRNDGVPGNQMKRYGKANERYKSSEVLSSSRGFYEGNNKNINQTGNTDYNEPSQIKNQNRTMNSSQNIHSNNDSGKLNSIKEFTPLMLHSYHEDPNPTMGGTPHRYSDSNDDRAQKSNNAAHSESDQVQSYHQGTVGDRQMTNHHSKSNSSHNQLQEDVRPRPVPVSRANRLARGHTLPGGFCFNEHDSNFHQFPKLDPDISLFHLTQKYDLAPLLINFPPDKILKDMTELSELTVEISMVEVSGLPSSPQGKMPQIGTPGSAFTPVKNTSDQSKPSTARIKVTCISHVWDEVHKYTTLGRVLKGDIVIEVNGWFCLGADVVFVKKVVEDCKGPVTLTVARLKESDEKRFKGQTAVERIKGLESEISRLDDLVLARDDRIRSLTSNSGSLTLKQHTGTLSDVNGRIPMEGMVIGGDEYVV